MTAALAVRMLFEPQRTLAFGSISGAYMGVGTAVDHPVRQFIVQNFTDQPLQFSFDGINDHFPVAAFTSMINDVSSNNSLSQTFLMGKGERLYVKTLGGAPTVGSVYFSVMYGKES